MKHLNTEIPINEGFIQDLHTFLYEDLKELENILRTFVKSEEPIAQSISEHIIASGGKKLRPILHILVCKMFDYQNSKIYYLSAAIELIHIATLLHDDIIDNSQYRRFIPTAHTVWGKSASILVGDYLFSQAFRLMVQTESLDALGILSEASKNIITGEIKQLSSLKKPTFILEEEYYKILSSKTAELFSASCEVAAIISGQTKEEISIIKEFGHELGMIYQITDDVIDYFSFKEWEGKSPSTDFKEGKTTLPIIILIQKTSNEEYKKIKNIFFAQDSRSEQDFKLILYLLKKYNILQEIKDILIKRKNVAQKLIGSSKGNLLCKKWLLGIIEFCYQKITKFDSL